MALRLRGRPATARAFAWTATLLVVCLPVVHAWYWLTPLALGLAAGEALPVALGLLAPLPEALAPALPAAARRGMAPSRRSRFRRTALPGGAGRCPILGDMRHLQHEALTGHGRGAATVPPARQSSSSWPSRSWPGA